MNEVKTEKKSNKLLIAIIIVNIILWPTLIYLLLDSNEPGPLTPAQRAYYFAQYAIKENLKVPDSAEFEPFDTAIINNSGGTVWEVTMWVKAENSFGAKIKSDYFIGMRYEGEQWRLLKLQEIE